MTAVVKTNKTLVLDLDSCLIQSYCSSGTQQANKFLSPDKIRHRHRFFKLMFYIEGDMYNYWGVKRPHLDEFLNFASIYFEKVIIWSAANYEYVHKVVDMIFQDHKYPDLILTEKDIVTVDKEDNDYHKPLSVIMNRYPGLIDIKTTLFLDDKLDNFRENPTNGLHIREFKPDENDVLKVDDHSLHSLIHWLLNPNVYSCSDVRKLDKSSVWSTKKTTNLKLKTNHKLFYSSTHY